MEGESDCVICEAQCKIEVQDPPMLKESARREGLGCDLSSMQTTHMCNYSVQEVEAGGSEFWGHHWLLYAMLWAA